MTCPNCGDNRTPWIAAPTPDSDEGTRQCARCRHQFTERYPTWEENEQTLRGQIDRIEALLNKAQGTEFYACICALQDRHMSLVARFCDARNNMDGDECQS